MLYSASHLTFIPTNQEPLSSTGKWHLARNSLPPRHLLTKIISKILLKMRDLTTFAVTTSSSSVGISKMTYQIKADIARITLSIFLSLETNIAWPWYVCTPVTIFFPWFVLINCYRGMTRCDQLPSTICDQVWPVTRCDQLSGVTPPTCYHNSFVTSCKLPGHTPGHKPYPSGPKLDQDLSPREGFRSLGPKVKEE